MSTEPRYTGGKRIYQCPGCWATTIAPNPADGDFECDFCHERLTCIDLRARADPPEPDWRMPESPDDVPHTTPRVYKLSGDPR